MKTASWTQRISIYFVVLAVSPLVMHCMYTPSQIQREFAKELTPDEELLSKKPKAGRAYRVMTLRVYADRGFRKNSRWRQRFEKNLWHINGVLSNFGIKLTIKQALPWNRRMLRPDYFSSLQELKNLDPGDDVDWVVGLVTDRVGLFDNQHLGMAELLSKHFIVQNMEDYKEYDQIQEHFDSLWEKEREELYRKRKSHREISVFLHEWAHTLGAIHTIESGWIMDENYSIDQMSFTVENQDIIMISLKHRLTDVPNVEAWSNELSTYIKKLHYPVWEKDDVQEMLALLRSVTKGANPVGPIQRTMISTLDEKEVQVFNDAIELSNQDNAKAALKHLEPLLEKHASESNIIEFACYLSARLENYKRTETLCQKAMLFPNVSARTYGSLSLALWDSKQFERANQTLAKARQAAQERKRLQAQNWIWLADVHRKASLVSHVQNLAEHGRNSWKKEDPGAQNLETEKQIENLLTWAVQTRKRSGLAPFDPTQTELWDEENTYLEQLRKAYSKLMTNKPNQAIRLVNAMNKEYPWVGPWLVKCEARRMQGRFKEAAQWCQKAVSRYPQASLGHIGLAKIHMQKRQWSKAVSRLNTTIELDPDWDEAWHMLQWVYNNTKNLYQVAQLKKRYQQHFGRSMSRVRFK